MIPTLSIAIPRIDNSALIAACDRRIAAGERRIARALEFAELPFARADAVIQELIGELVLVADHDADHDRLTAHDLLMEDGAEAPTQETWNALTLDEREEMLNHYVDVECRTGEWEWNPWAPLIERNCTALFAKSVYR